jgi:hypothetical protein
MIRGKVLSPLKPSPKNSFWLATFVIYCRNRERFLFSIDMLALKKKNKDRRFIFKFLVAFLFLFYFLDGFFLLLVKRHKCLNRKQIKEIWMVCVSENSPPHFSVCVSENSPPDFSVWVSENSPSDLSVCVCVWVGENSPPHLCLWVRERTHLLSALPSNHTSDNLLANRILDGRTDRQTDGHTRFNAETLNPKPEHTQEDTHYTEWYPDIEGYPDIEWYPLHWVIPIITLSDIDTLNDFSSHW